MSLLDPDSSAAVVSRRDMNAKQALPAVIAACAGDMLIGGETHAEMFARKSYEIADAMEARRAAR